MMPSTDVRTYRHLFVGMPISIPPHVPLWQSRQRRMHVPPNRRG